MVELAKVEEQIMKILWGLEKGVVKDIIEQMPGPKPAYNTVSTMVRILETKGFIGHKAYGRTHEYFPLISKDEYLKFSVGKLLKGYFDGSLTSLVSFFAKENDVKIHEIEQLLEEIKKSKP